MSTTSHDSFTDSHGSDGLLSKIRRMGSAVFTTTDEHPAVIELHRAERRKRRPSEGTTASSRLRRLALLESALIRSFNCHRSEAFEEHVEPIRPTPSAFSATHLRPFTFASLSELNKLDKARRRQSMQIGHVLPALPPMRSLQEMIEMDESTSISFPERVKGLMRISGNFAGWSGVGGGDGEGLGIVQPVVGRKARSRFVEMV